MNGNRVCSNDVRRPFPKEDLLQNHWANLTKLGRKHSWVTGIQVCSYKGPRPIQRVDNNTLQNLKKFFSITTGSFSTKLGTKEPCVIVSHVCSNEEPRSFPRGENNVIIFLKNLLHNHYVIFNHT